MKTLRSLVMLGILCALPVIAMWSEIRPRLGPWADDAEAAIKALVAQAGLSGEVTNSGEATEAPPAAAPLPGQPLPAAVDVATDDAVVASPGTTQELPTPRPAPPLPREMANSTPSAELADRSRRTLERPVYRPLAGEAADTIERQTNPENATTAESGHLAARMNAEKITRRLQDLGAAGYRLQTDDATGDYHFEASFADPSEPAGVRRFSARDTDGQLAMRQVLRAVETWQESR